MHLRIVVADDHPPTRAGVRTVLEADGFEVCAEAADARSAVEAVLRERPDVCLVDVDIPGSGIAAAAEINAKRPETAVVMLTVSTNEDDLFDALRAGAAGYLLKETNPERLPHALRGVTSGEAALSRTLVARVIEEFRQRGQRKRVVLAQRRAVDLTSREWEVLELLRHGLSTAEIAKRLFIAPVTVRTHVGSLLRKLDAPDREAAVRMADGAR